MIIPNYHLLINMSMTGPFHCCRFRKHDKWWRHEPGDIFVASNGKIIEVCIESHILPFESCESAIFV